MPIEIGHFEKYKKYRKRKKKTIMKNHDKCTKTQNKFKEISGESDE